MPTFVDTGKAIVANRMLGLGTEPKFVGIGTGATAEAAAQTALVTEVETRPAAPTSSRVTTTVANDTYQTISTVTATVARAVTESGMFDAAAAGNMLTRALFSVINLAIGDSLQLTWQLKFS